MKKNSFDCIYIDGSHDYEVVLADYRNSVASLKPGGILVMDDSSLGTDFSPPKFSFAGHPGPSRVAREFADRELVFLAGVGHQNVYRRV
jgi:predicted O-methyltransferase YrrM